MIIKGLLEVLLKAFSALTSAINIPQLPEEVHGYIETLLGYIKVGISILANYTHIEFLLVLFGLVLAVDVGIAVYHFVMWVLRKIPMLGIE